MIIITGTKRSGTSMWMQILRAAGFEIVGLAFPKDWGEVIREANPEGFYESPLRRGINFQTNPHPVTGVYLPPEVCRHMAVKVFIPGVVRSDLAFIDKVLASIRNWREYHSSLVRLYTMEQERRRPDAEPPQYLTPTYEWWNENYSLLRDFVTRRYPIHVTAYESVLEQPEKVVGEALEWLGMGDLDRAVEAIRPELKTQNIDRIAEVPDIPPEIADVLDELYERIRDRRGLEASYIEQLNTIDEQLQPKIREELKQRRQARARNRKETPKNRSRHDGVGSQLTTKERTTDDAPEHTAHRRPNPQE